MAKEMSTPAINGNIQPFNKGMTHTKNIKGYSNFWNKNKKDLTIKTIYKLYKNITVTSPECSEAFLGIDLACCVEQSVISGLTFPGNDLVEKTLLL